jgi:hypothetical protein
MVMGFRSFPDGFAYVVLDGTQAAPKVIGKNRVSLPRNYSWPASLSWVRKQIAEILESHVVTSACIKVIEHTAQRKSVERFQIEAILAEYLHTKRSIDCTTRIKSQLKRDISGFTDPARYIEKVLTQSGVLAELNTKEYQDATLAALAELPED